MKEMPNAPDTGCSCLPQADQDAIGCQCGISERGLRDWAYNGRTAPMTVEQRAWCVDQVRSCSDATDQPDTFDDHPDDLLARAVLCAWQDYARDKGLI